MRTAAAVRLHKEKHPEMYCRVTRCLWRTGGPHGSPCRNHPEHKPHPGPSRPAWWPEKCKCYTDNGIPVTCRECSKP